MPGRGFRGADRPRSGFSGDLSAPGHDEAERVGENLIGGEVRRVEDDRIPGRFRRSGPAGLVAGVALLEILENGRVCSRLAARLQLVESTTGPDFGPCGDVEFDRGVGADDRSDVAAVEDRPRRLARESPLELDEGRADLRVRGDDRCGASDGLAAQTVALQIRGLERARRCRRAS